MNPHIFSMNDIQDHLTSSLLDRAENFKQKYIDNKT